jgi:hypothetical protein
LLCALLQGSNVQATESPSAKAAAPAKSAPIHALTQSAFTAGALTCARRINDIANFLSTTASSGALLFPPATDADRHSVSASMELTGSGQDAYVSTTFHPDSTGSCEATYDAVIWWPTVCEAVARSQFSTLKPQSLLHKKIRILDGGLNMKVFLMPAGTGCVSIKKEIIR